MSIEIDWLEIIHKDVMPNEPEKQFKLPQNKLERLLINIGFIIIFWIVCGVMYETILYEPIQSLNSLMQNPADSQSGDVVFGFIVY